MVLAGVVGSVVIPALSDKYKKRKPFLLLAALVAVPTLFLIAQLDSTRQIYLVSIVTGFFILSAFPLMLTLSEETTGHRLTGTGTAILLLLGNAGGVFLTLVMESIMNATGGKNNSYYWAMMFVVFLFAIAFVVALFIREKNTRFPVEP
jgi:MFS family permease